MEVEKRVMCQPMTFTLSSRENQAIITINAEEGRSRLVDILTDVVIERVFYEEGTRHMTDVGYTPEFINSYLTRELVSEINKTTWHKELYERLEESLKEKENSRTNEEGLTTDIIKEWDLEAFTRFQTHSLRHLIQGFLTLCDEEVKDQLTHVALAPMVTMMTSKDLPEENEEELTIELIREEDELILHLGEDWNWLMSDMEDNFASMLNQKVYYTNSVLYQEYMENLVLVFVALIFPVKEFIVDEEEKDLLETLPQLLKAFDIQTKVIMHDFAWN